MKTNNLVIGETYKLIWTCYLQFLNSDDQKFMEVVDLLFKF